MDDVGGRLSWSALNSFIRNLDTDSALARELGEYTGWETTLKTNLILADIVDLLAMINANLMSLGGKNRKPKPYPRPTDKKKDKQKIGNGALPLSDLREWIKEKRNGKR